MTKISFAQFHNSEEDPLYWYDFLIDAIEISDIPSARPLRRVAEDILDSLPEPGLRDLDVLAALLINGDRSQGEFLRWRTLFRDLSSLMASQLVTHGERPLRMRCQRLVYAIQLRCSAAEGLLDPPTVEPTIRTEFHIPGRKPWDYLAVGDEKWWISSGERNVHHLDEAGRLVEWRLGLPTQIDRLDDGSLIAGSFYSDGAYLLEGGQWRPVVHSEPIITGWTGTGGLILLDTAGRIIDEAGTEPPFCVGRPQVHFARRLGQTLFALDNSDVGHITVVDLKTMESKRVNVDPVLVCNDITFCAGAYYLIDKQQGHIFKFDTDFRFVARALTFGPGPGQLMDPVSIRAHDGMLTVVSWINSKAVVVSPF